LFFFEVGGCFIRCSFECQINVFFLILVFFFAYHAIFRSPRSVIVYPPRFFLPVFDPETTCLFFCFLATFYQLALVNMASTLSYFISIPLSVQPIRYFILRYTTTCHSFLSSRLCVYGFVSSQRYRPSPLSTWGLLFLLFPSISVALLGDADVDKNLKELLAIATPTAFSYYVLYYY
jgi:hypothetical protein